jgi:hypothetical protein
MRALEVTPERNTTAALKRGIRSARHAKAQRLDELYDARGPLTPLRGARILLVAGCCHRPLALLPRGQVQVDTLQRSAVLTLVRVCVCVCVCVCPQESSRPRICVAASRRGAGVAPRQPPRRRNAP